MTVLGQAPLIGSHWARFNLVMPAEVGIHDFAAFDRRKAWMPTAVGMTGLPAPTLHWPYRLVLGAHPPTPMAHPNQQASHP